MDEHTNSFPSPSPDPWEEDQISDFDSATNDDERRALLLEFGYDEAHRLEAEELFPQQQTQPLAPQKDHHLQPEQRQYTDLVDKQHQQPDKRPFPWTPIGTILGLLGLIITLLIHFGVI